MNKRNSHRPCKNWRLVIAAAVAGSTMSLHAEKTEIASTPISSLTASASPVALNMMVVIDESGSMTQDWAPFQLKGNAASDYKLICRQTDTGCNRGDPPLVSPEINGLAYDPTRVYKPPIDADGSNTTYPSYSTPLSWTAVRNDPFSNADAQRSSPDLSVINLLTSYPETVYCTSAADDITDSSKCKRNGIDASDYVRGNPGDNGGVGFPDATYKVAKTRYGAPFYYRVTPREYCKDASLRQCRSTVQSDTYKYPAYIRMCNTKLAVSYAPGTSGPVEWTYDPSVEPPNNSCQLYYISEPTASSFRKFPNARFGSFTRYAVSSAEMENFANWYAYYRTKTLAMKSSMSFAFFPLNQNYRIGYMGSYYNPYYYAGAGSKASASYTPRKFLPVQQFDATGKALWYRTLYGHPHPGTSGMSGTNLVAPLSRLGMYFAGKLTENNKSFIKESLADTTLATIPSPITESCQANYAILITDGAQNDPSWAGATKIDGLTVIGDQDGPASLVNAPYKDAYGQSNTLSDVASYLYNTDLRPDLANEVRATQNDTATHQHVTTYTITFGAGGGITWEPDYATNPNTEFQKLKNGSLPWPLVNGPDGDGGTKVIPSAAIDDTWHAAINGHGEYFSVDSPATFSAAMTKIINSLIIQSEQTGGGAPTASPVLSTDANFTFVSAFKNFTWDGDLRRIEVDSGTAQFATDPFNQFLPTWSAQTILESAGFSSRNIYVASSVGPNGLKAFTWGNLAPDEQANFTTFSGLSHYNTLTPIQLSGLTGASLVDFLRGSRANEAAHNDIGYPDEKPSALYRKREHILGDATSEPIYVNKPVNSYTDPGYQSWANSLTRTPTVFMGGNDGMLHAFNATAGLPSSGAERWAYIPSALMSKLYKLADKNYSSDHQFYVAGPVVSGDIAIGSPATNWKSILVAGLGGGGRGYFAIDITADSPKLLWEFSAGPCIVSVPTTQKTDCDLGYAFGSPIITKNAGGRWVVILTSGYDNGDNTQAGLPNAMAGEPIGTGKGYVYVLDAYTGEVLNKVTTGVGTPDSPSGLAHLSAWADNAKVDNTTLRLYGGDLEGNLWRFEGPSATNSVKVVRVATLTASTGQKQPVTTAPAFGEVNKKAMIFVGTGRLLGSSDLAKSSTAFDQSFYGIKDDLSAAPNVVRSSLVKQNMSVPDINTQLRVTDPVKPVDLNNTSGWFIDLNPGGASPGERSHTSARVSLGSVYFTTYQPPTNLCAQGVAGTSYLYGLNFTNGAVVKTQSASGLASRVSVVQTTGNNIQVFALVSTGKAGGAVGGSLPAGSVVRNGNQCDANSAGVCVLSLPPLSATTGATRRVSWQEILVK